MQAANHISSKQRSYTLFMLVMVFTSSHVDRQIVAILAPPIKEAFQISDTQLGLLTGVMFALFYATLGMPMAMWADRGNRRNIIALAIAMWSAMTALCGTAQAYWQLLLYRIGVGVGEAGSNPPSHSIIADLYPPAERATAMAIFATGVNIGIMLGYLIGGWVNEWLDWRWAFIIAGVPGLLIAVVVRMTIIEPPRGLSEPDKVVEKPPPFMDVARAMWGSPVLRNTIAGNTLASFSGYALVAWAPTYFIRLHDMSSGEVGTLLALMIGLGGGVGTFAAGWIADKLGYRNAGWRAWVPAAAATIYLPFAYLCYTAESAFVAAAAFAIPAMIGGAYIGTGFAIIQNALPVSTRSVGAAINLFISNIVGLGLGPVTVGLISDGLRPSYGDDSLRYGLIAMVGIMAWAGAHYFHTGRLLAKEQATEREQAPV